jgi:hypothetical protein
MTFVQALEQSLALGAEAALQAYLGGANKSDIETAGRTTAIANAEQLLLNAALPIIANAAAPKS